MTQATTHAVLLRGEITEDELGDEVIDNSPAAIIAKSFPISIIETSSHEFDQASNQWRSIRKLTARPTGRDPGVDEGDRIKDLRDGAIYAVDKVIRTARGIAGRSSVTMTLRRTAP